MIVYLDMDGVLSDFDSHIIEMLGHPSDSRDEIRQCMREEGFFTKLKVMPGANEAVAHLLKLLPGHIQILSAVPHSSPELAEVAERDKRIWLAEHFPMLAFSAEIVTDKSTVGTPQDYLIDDHPEWNGTENFPGTVIKFNGPQDWEQIYTEITKHQHMVKASRLLNRDLDAL